MTSFKIWCLHDNANAALGEIHAFLSHRVEHSTGLTAEEVAEIDHALHARYVKLFGRTREDALRLLTEQAEELDMGYGDAAPDRQNPDE